MSFSEGMFVSFSLGDIYMNIMILKKQQRIEDYGQTFETKNPRSVRWFGSESHFSLQFPCESLLQVKNAIKDIGVFTGKKKNKKTKTKHFPPRRSIKSSSE